MVDTNDEMWYTNGTKYDSGIENTPSSQGRVRRAVVNRLVNADFSSGWTQTKEYGSDTYSIDSSVTCLAVRSAKMVKKGAGELRSTSQAKLFNTGKYTFSAYVKTTGLTVAEGKKGAFLRVTIGDNVYESEGIKDDTSAREKNTFASGWERVYVTFPFTRPEGMDELTASSVTVALVCDASSGTVYFTAPQVESGEIANIFNLLVNGDFSVTKPNNACSAGTRYFPENWTTLGDGLSNSNVLNMQTGVVFDRNENRMPANVEGNALRLYSFLATSDIYMSQIVKAGGQKDDVFVLGGWANSHSVQSGYTLSKPAIRISFLRTADAKWIESNLCFTTENDSWHHMTAAVAAPVAYSQIQISVSYPQNNKTCMFSQIYLYKDLYGASFTYDEKGNVVTVSDLTNQKSQAQYDDYNNLLSYVQPGSANTEKYTFTYGDTETEKKRHLPLTSATPMGVKSATTYDQYGNSTANVVHPSANAPFMRSETVYTNNGNYASSWKDARGNVTNTFQTIHGKVLGVSDPTGHWTMYDYDDSNRLTLVSSDRQLAEGFVESKNEYEYTNDRLTKISHNTTSNDCDVHYTFDDVYDTDVADKVTSIMNAFGTAVQSRDIEKVLSAFSSGKWQKWD